MCEWGEFLMSDYIVTDTELTSIADAIRTKGGTSSQLAFPAGFVSEIQAIPSGGGGVTILGFTKYGFAYWENMDISLPNGALIANMFSSSNTPGVTGIKTIRMHNNGLVASESINKQNVCKGCTGLTSASIECIQNYGHYWFQDCSNLKTVQLGSIDVPVVKVLSLTFAGCTQSDLTITVYVNAATIADIITDVISTAPWGATNATIVYKSSTTGEVLA